jgi:hypothetical protein
MSGYIGVQPVPQTTQTRQGFTATAGQTSFGTSGYQAGFLDVYLNGVKLAAADYTATNGSDVVLSAGAAVNDILEIVAFETFTVSDGTFSGTTTINTLTVTNDGAGSNLDADQLDGQHGAYYAVAASTTSALDLKAPLASPTLTGNPVAPTQTAGNNSTRIATTAYADTAITNLVDSSPAAMNTLNELAAALGDDANFSTTVTNSIATKLPLAGGALTGALTTNSTIDGRDVAADGVTADAALPKAGGAITGNVTFGDGNRAIFGSDTDMQLFHNGSSGTIANSTGSLVVRTDAFRVLNASNSEQILHGDADGAVTAYFNNAAKLATTATGISVTGTVTAGGGKFLTERGTAAAPVYSFSDDTDTGMFNIGNADLGFSVGGTTRMTLDASGNLLVGKTASNGAAAGNEFLSYGRHLVTAANTTVQIINRTGSNDGTITLFEKNGAAVGSVGVASGDITIDGASEHTGLRFEASAITPRHNGAASNSYVNLGSSSVTWENLYLSGGVVFGGAVSAFGTTSSSNKLDDYEEGTWTPVPNNFHVNAIYHAKYTKIGRQVTVIFYIVALNGTSLPASIGGLPFTSTSNGYSVGAVNITVANPTTTNIQLRVASSSTSMFVLTANDGSVPAASVDSGHIIGTVTYFTDS